MIADGETWLPANPAYLWLMRFFSRWISTSAPSGLVAGAQAQSEVAEQVAQQAMTAGKQIEEAILLFNYGAVAEFPEFLRECGSRTREPTARPRTV